MLGVKLVPLALVALAIAACGGDDEGDASTTSTPAEGSSTAGQTAAGERGGRSRDRASGAGEGSGGSGEGAGGSEGVTQPPSEEAPTGPVTPYGPPGTPEGTVEEGGGESADEDAVVRALRAYLVAISRADGPQACAQLTPAGRRRVEREVHRAAPETRGSPCEGAIVLYQGAYGDAIRDPRITDVRVTGERATAVGPLRQQAVLIKRGGVWLIDSYRD